MTQRTLYFIKDETGVVLSYYPTLKTMREAFDWYIEQGLEPDTGHVTYTPTRAGVAALLNSLKEDA